MLLLSFLLDLVIGDPTFIVHPVVIIGKMISAGEDILRKVFAKTEKAERIAGCILTVFVVAISFLFTGIMLCTLYSINFFMGFTVEVFICSQMLAAKSLQRAAMAVHKALESSDIKASRKAISMIVGRDTAELTENEIIKATVETVSENTSDGVTAPMLFMMLGGAPLAMAYKAINTMDSMIGYKNERYLHFGRFAARLDDVANFIPARITGFLLCCAAFLLRLNHTNAFKIFLRDRKNHKSPNAAHLEAACAGALGISLGGSSSYFGKIVDKPYIGDALREPNSEDIILSVKLMYVTSAIAVTVFSALKLFVL